MRGNKLTRRLFVMVLIISITFSMMPLGFANAETGQTDSGEPAVSTENVDTDQDVTEPEDGETVGDYDTFMSLFETLEAYGDQYVKAHPKEDAIQLVLNYVRTGVERYSGMAWDTFGGVENKNFATFVNEQDKANNTQVSLLKKLKEFILVNGDTVDFGHLFGTMNITYYSSYKPENSDMNGHDLSPRHGGGRGRGRQLRWRNS